LLKIERKQNERCTYPSKNEV